MTKKVSFKNSRNLTLIGTLWEAPSQAIIIMAHGSGSNRFAKGLFNSIAEALQKENYNILSFDFSGHGESENDVLTVKKSIDDLVSAIAFVKEKGYKKIALLGHSLGALACLEAFSPEIETMILIGALTGPVQWKWEDMCSAEQINSMYRTGYIAAEVNDGLRKLVKIDGNLLKDIQAINQKKLLSKIVCPVLIIHGDSDQQERDLLESSKKGLAYLSPSSQLKIMQGANHTFLDVSNKVIGLIKEWLPDYLPLN